MHDKAHGQVPHQVIEVDASIVESFLGRIGDPEKAQNTALNIINDPAFRTIMVVEIMKLASGDTKPESDKIFAGTIHNMIRDLLDKKEGNIVKQSANLILVSFKSVSNAVRAAKEINQQFNNSIDSDHVNKGLLKIGLSAGVPVTEKKAFFEDTIRLAERMCQVVAGEIIVSSEVRELYNSENAVSLKVEKGIYPLLPEDERFLNLLMDYIESSWNNTNLKVDDFSSTLGYSKSQFYRKLTRLTGKSPNIFIRDYRLNEALKLLNRKEGTVSEIAFETGFTSPSYFSKCFLARYGYLPSGARARPAGQ
jgi:AraC-like DNA-binding protein